MLGISVLEYIKDKLVLSGISAGTVVHIGCGPCVEIDSYTGMSFQKIYLFDANEEVCDQLKFRCAAHSGIEIEHTVVADTNDRRKFYRTNCQDFDSLKDPKNLTGFFPNLKALRSLDVETVALERVLQKIAVDEKKFNVLIAEIGGSEWNIFQSVNAIELQKYSILLIKGVPAEMGTITLYDDLDLHLKKSHFNPVLQDESEHPCKCNIYLRNDDGIHIELLTNEKEQIRRDYAALTEKMNELDKILIKTQIDLEDLRKQHGDLKRDKLLQERIMQQVAQRLQYASDLYVKLASKYPELRHLGETVFTPIMGCAGEGEKSE